ncbi:HTH-type transcriptional activator IlvY [Aliiglaciecola sp. LCG003]|uniref:HTH-type transcriptional activator IlvY n=1 Tax=Aliiglaciecola sp. LCG003 TaxID=3053655 RepID=UPI0025725F0A|nr:HTH-type transcriptional activator IlvY [Aliiglaciecola sp. LCG003]WJG11351.1 HTH-type transcriptional activator IlvY [Aliiglaciecola sp. LCG003]
MDIRSLQLFVHLANSLHFGKTAEALFVSPSTLSRAIQRLEEECGAELFIRDNRKVKLTIAGEKMRAFSQQTLSAWHGLRADLDQLNPLLTGEIKLYCSVTASQSHLPDILNRFRQQHPQVEVKLTTGDHALSVSKVLDQHADVAISVHTPDFPKELAFFPLDTIPLLLIAPKDSNINSLQQVDWTANSVILPESGPSKRIVHHWFAEMGIRPRVYATVGGNEAIVSMVALGCGLGIVPKVVLDNSVASKKVNQMPIDNIEPYKLGLCCLKARVNEVLIDAMINQAEILK